MCSITAEKGVTLALTDLNKMLLICGPPPQPHQTIICHPSVEKSAFVRAMGSSTICYMTWEESCPPMCQVIGIQNSALALDLAVVHGLSLAPLGYGL